MLTRRNSRSWLPPALTGVALASAVLWPFSPSLPTRSAAARRTLITAEATWCRFSPMAMLAAYMVGMFSLSCYYVIPTYLVPRRVTAYL
jgi:hypothetical protein